MTQIPFALITLPLFAVLCASCAHQAPPALKVDARFSNLYYDGFRNRSNLASLGNWPTDTLRHRVLMRSLEDLSGRFRNELLKYAQRGSYRLADRKDLADLVVSLEFLDASLQKDTLVLPVQLRIEDRRDNSVMTPIFWIRAAYPGLKRESGLDAGYHYFGGLLAEMERRFPFQGMAALFYAHDPALQ